jgi:predicted DNA-binding transcriptional regulator AlpA
MTDVKTISTKRKASAKKKQPQQPWLRRENQPIAPKFDETLRTADAEHAADRPQAPPRLMSKHEVCALVGSSFPTLWTMMRRGEFPRSRVVGGKSLWLSSEVTAWMAALPVRRLKGDFSPLEVA